MKIKPLFDRVLIEPEKKDNVSKFGIILPDSAQIGSQVGKVIAIGDGENMDGDKTTMKVKIGDKVVFNKFAGSEIKIDDKDYIIMRQIDINTELVTPTGAAIIAQLADSYGPMPAMKDNKIGWGIGTKQLKIPNVLKVTLGEIAQHPDEVIIMESNVDDCTGEMLGFVMEKMMHEGARDVFFTPIFMKKNRPAYRITVVTDEEHMKRMEELLFLNTTTIGFRYRKEKRHVLNREIVDVKLPEGVVKGKKVDFEQESYIYPEYESLKSLSEETRIPLKELYKRFQREV